MRILLTFSFLALSISAVVSAKETERVYKWIDENGIAHYGDSVPAEYRDMEKTILNEHGVMIDSIRGKKTEEEIAEELRLAELEAAIKAQKQQDAALLATYMSVEEILMHRDRRVELFQAQTRVTELYLRNLDRRLEKLLAEAAGFQPYSEDPEAPMIDPDLSKDILTTRETIERHEGNLKRFETDEAEIKKRFEKDINRFKRLKGLETMVANPSSDD